MSQLVKAFPSVGDDLSGKKFNNLLVIKLAGAYVRHKGPGGRFRLWLCRCDCGAEKLVRGDSLKKGTTRSCGCKKEARRIAACTKHGMSGVNEHPIYRKWDGMKSRCYQKNHASYSYYGGKGIRVDEPWKSSFQAFYDDMIATWKPGYSLERKDVDKNYNKANCCWIPWKQQWENTSRIVYAKFEGRVQSVMKWAKEFGISLPEAHKKLRRFRVDKKFI